MAEATRTETTVTTTETRYTLELTEAEFVYLKNLIGIQPGTDGEGASRRIWDALKAPADGVKEDTPKVFHEGDRVTVARGARSANGSELGWVGHATVNHGPDSDGDYSVTGSYNGRVGYVLPEYLTAR
ncbi:hypothetical protein [Streptomyces sp. NPDC058644]|uniref:hypothetical protein n=1 Tax=unclassified Streptomyces TaxID=2593676 RepID=UPI0036541C11